MDSLGKDGNEEVPSLFPQNPASEQHSSDAQVPTPGPQRSSVPVPPVLPEDVVFVAASQFPYVD